MHTDYTQTNEMQHNMMNNLINHLITNKKPPISAVFGGNATISVGGIGLEPTTSSV
jgi:hypothetical protein